MRIGINASIVDPFLSGLGVYAVNVLQEVNRLCDDVVVYTPYPEICNVDSAKIRRISKRVRLSLGPKGYFLRIIWVQTSLQVRLLMDKASLLFSPLPEGMILPVVPQILTVLDVTPLHFPKEYPLQGYYLRYFVSKLLRKSRRIIAISANTKQDIITSYGIKPERINVTLPGYDRIHYRLGVEPGAVKSKYGLKSYLFYLGNLMPHKNLRRLLRAFALLKREFPYTLVIAGWKDPRHYPALEAETQALGLAEKVLFLNYVPADELPALYSGAELFVFPSLYEGFGLPPLEAMACGCPVLVSNIASLSEVCGDAAYYVDPYDVKNIAEGIYRVATDRELKENLAFRGTERAKLFSWEKSAKEHIKIFEEVLGVSGKEKGETGE
jgi:glycosyltransferase involved in cell wall biosynthesis